MKNIFSKSYYDSFEYKVGNQVFKNIYNKYKIAFPLSWKGKQVALKYTDTHDLVYKLVDVSNQFSNNDVAGAIQIVEQAVELAIKDPKWQEENKELNNRVADEEDKFRMR